MAKTSASFTLMDYTDGISLITGIDSNLPRTSLYDTATQLLNPSWAGGTSLQLTPTVLKAGSATQLALTSMAWQRRLGSGTWTAVVSGSNGETINATTGVLSVNVDKLTGDVWQVEYKFTASYYDSILKLTFPIETTITFSRVANGTSFVVARAYAIGGSQFKNNLPSTLKLLAELIRGTTHDATNLTYLWSKSVNGTTWTALTSAVTGYNAAELTVTPSLVDSFAMFRCTITDTDATSETYNQTFNTEGVSILDVSDPYQAIIQSTAGSYFKNNEGSTILICEVYQDGAAVDTTGSSLNYTWTKTDKDGAAVTGFTATGIATAWKGASIVATNKKAISVSSNDVDIKASYFCEVN